MLADDIASHLKAHETETANLSDFSPDDFEATVVYLLFAPLVATASEGFRQAFLVRRWTFRHSPTFPLSALQSSDWVTASMRRRSTMDQNGSWI